MASLEQKLAVILVGLLPLSGCEKPPVSPTPTIPPKSATLDFQSCRVESAAQQGPKFVTRVHLICNPYNQEEYSKLKNLVFQKCPGAEKHLEGGFIGRYLGEFDTDIRDCADRVYSR